MKALANYDKYQKYFSDDQFWGKVKKLVRKAGIKIVYIALLLYYVMIRQPQRLTGQRSWEPLATSFFLLTSFRISFL